MKGVGKSVEPFLKCGLGVCCAVSMRVAGAGITAVCVPPAAQDLWVYDHLVFAEDHIQHGFLSYLACIIILTRERIVGLCIRNQRDPKQHKSRGDRHDTIVCARDGTRPRS